ncbi:hypothetical protein PC121_g25517, partial [Phytophthora cactorum]
YHPETSARY